MDEKTKGFFTSKIQFELFWTGEIDSIHDTLMVLNANALRALHYSLACKCSLHLWSTMQVTVVLLPWWDWGHYGVFTPELDLLYVLLDSIAYVSLKADQPVTPSLVFFYFGCLATLSLNSFHGGNVWKMSVEEADFGMANISLPTDVSEIQRPQQLCSNCRQQLHRQLEACGWGSTLRLRCGRQQAGVVAHTVVFINSGCLTKQFRYLVRCAHCYNIQKTWSDLSP